MGTGTNHDRALELIQRAMNFQMAGDLDESIRLYRESIAVCPTADAHTYLGWAYSFQGRIDKAIAECEIAIKLDPEFGNPYNDIGVYLMQQEKFDEAIPWLERAKTAKRYEPRHFPYLNLGRVYAAKGMMIKALEEFREALRLHPDDSDLAEFVEQFEFKLQ
ncbi:MAG: tetratricopeptide repeat protein [Deltaproteobacteria bacterium]|nr:tetratricopeptide repeat protein [Deltaproteobacteria bacterium]MDZ4341171.1 tetratricopeptide repeat protein [Candidatus Binatia bacterium]